MKLAKSQPAQWLAEFLAHVWVRRPKNVTRLLSKSGTPYLPDWVFRSISDGMLSTAGKASIGLKVEPT